MATRREEITAQLKQLEDYEDDATTTAKKLRKSVAASSSESARIMQTLGHLGGKEAGEASDAAIRQGENLKESEAEDQERRAKDLHDRRFKLGGEYDKLPAPAVVKALRKK